jgi:hypothetical protein
MARSAFFAGLVYDQDGNPLAVAMVGETPCYVILDGGFRRHLDADVVDRQVLTVFREQMLENREIVTSKMMEMLGKDDLFTKAMIDRSLAQNNVEQLLDHSLPPDARDMLGMVGFRIVIDEHGEIAELKMPEQPDSRDE